MEILDLTPLKELNMTGKTWVREGHGGMTRGQFLGQMTFFQ